MEIKKIYQHEDGVVFTAIFNGQEWAQILNAAKEQLDVQNNKMLNGSIQF